MNAIVNRGGTLERCLGCEAVVNRGLFVTH
jgi:hypothetical protein